MPGQHQASSIADGWRARSWNRMNFEKVIIGNTFPFFIECAKRRSNQKKTKWRKSRVIRTIHAHAIQFSILAVSASSPSPLSHQFSFLIFNNAKCEWQNGEFSSCKPKRCILLPIVVYSYISDAVAMNAEKIYSFAVHSGCVVWCPIQHAFIDWKFTVFPIYRNLYRLGGRRSADCTIYSNQLSESEVKTASHCHTPMSFGSVPLQLWCALLSNWEWDETHNGVKYIGRYFQFPSERDKGSSSSTLSLSHCTPSRFPCRANDAITGFRWQILMLTCTARTCRIILPLPSTLSRQK